MIEGKTVARVIDQDGYEPWIIFTDGSGMRLVGWEDGADYNEVTAGEIAEHEAKLAERALVADKAKALQESWMMRSCDERAEIRSEWLAAPGRQGKKAKTFFMGDLLGQFEDDMIRDLNSSVFGQQPANIKARCPNCNERTCPNAPDLKPRSRRLIYSAGTITIPTR